MTEILPEPEAPAERATKKKAPAKAKPRTGSLFKDMSVETVTLEQAVQLLSLPRVVGTDPESGEEITAQNGRYGPYLKKGTDSRSLTSEDQLFTVTLDEALEIYRQPKQRGRRSAAATPPLRELGADAATKKPMVIKDGRFGPYVTDGETNASLRKGDSVEEITDERAVGAAGRAPGRRPRRRRSRRPASPPPRSPPRRRRRARRRRPRSSARTQETGLVQRLRPVYGPGVLRANGVIAARPAAP